MASFKAIRLEPYLLATAEHHPDLREPLLELAEQSAQSKHSLIHGDVSPKNMLLGPDGPVFSTLSAHVGVIQPSILPFALTISCLSGFGYQ